MKFTHIRLWSGLAAVLLIASCQSQNVSERYKQDGLVFVDEIEPVKGRTDVYQSMARAVKYNVDNASLNLNKKIFTQDPSQDPKTVIKNIMNSDINDRSSLLEASNVLEYAIIYGISHLQEKRPTAELGLYLKSSQHLALATIRAHHDTWFAMKKIKEIDRLLAKENKNLEALKQKQERQGMLSLEDIEYKKNLEVALLKLNEIRSALAFRQTEYSQLIQANPDKLELEGRRFYELEDFDRKYNLEIFQESAVRHRTEFAAAKENGKYYSYVEVRDNAIRDYPEIARLDINGVSLGHELYEKELRDRALLIANNLVDAVTSYQKATPLFKDSLRRKAYDELGAAIMAQIQINYCLVKLADVEYQHLGHEIAKKKKEVLALEKRARTGNVQNLELLNQKIKLIELQRRQSQVNAERAVSLRSLYFNAGLSPFSKRNLKLSVKEITALLRTSFNKDLVEMLSAVSEEIKRLPKPKKNDWAKEDNWLENLMKQPVKKTKAVVAKQAEKPVAQGKKAVAGKRLQLGAYMDKKNVAPDWEKITDKMPELKDYQIKVEPAEVSGVVFWRMFIEPDAKEVQPLCQKILENGLECLVR